MQPSAARRLSFPATGICEHRGTPTDRANHRPPASWITPTGEGVSTPGNSLAILSARPASVRRALAVCHPRGCPARGVAPVGPVHRREERGRVPDRPTSASHRPTRSPFPDRHDLSSCGSLHLVPLLPKFRRASAPPERRLRSPPAARLRRPSLPCLWLGAPPHLLARSPLADRGPKPAGNRRSSRGRQGRSCSDTPHGRTPPCSQKRRLGAPERAIRSTPPYRPDLGKWVLAARPCSRPATGRSPVSALALPQLPRRLASTNGSPEVRRLSDATLRAILGLLGARFVRPALPTRTAASSPPRRQNAIERLPARPYRPRPAQWPADYRGVFDNCARRSSRGTTRPRCRACRRGPWSWPGFGRPAVFRRPSYRHTNRHRPDPAPDCRSNRPILSRRGRHIPTPSRSASPRSSREAAHRSESATGHRPAPPTT